MIKIAFFVEGQTERIFLETLLDNYFTHPYFNVESYQIIEDKATLITKAHYNNANINLSFLIFDVTGDGNVNGAILERSESLINKSGFTHIYGLRDLFPHERDSLPLLQNAFQEVFSGFEFYNQLTQVIAIMEIEAWFIADYNHFAKMNPRLTTDLINTELKLNTITDSIEDYPHPSQIINQIWHLIGRTYRKRASDSYSICSYLDYTLFCCDEALQTRIPSFTSFLRSIDESTS